MQLVISAQDGGGLQAQPNARVNISIVEGTVSPPVFEQAQYFFSVPEDMPQGASVGAVRAQNPPGMGLSLLHVSTFPVPTPSLRASIHHFLMEWPCPGSSTHSHLNVPPAQHLCLHWCCMHTCVSVHMGTVLLHTLDHSFLTVGLRE